ncbi:MAG TPA: hypothetical protein VE153_09715 [Myxococcus sp.]|nr:hypothetical protein [Myxococcus sp.]
MKANRWLVLVGMALSLWMTGCRGEAGPGDEVDAGSEQEDSGTPGTDAGTDAGLPDGGGDGQCLGVGVSCSRASGAACCTGTCSDAGVCPEPSSQCTPAGSACTSGIQCCTQSCLNNTCSNQQCLDVGGACSNAETCCTKVCGANGQCAPLPGSATCKVPGQTCASGAECCSTNCQAGICKPAYTCQANNDLCMKGTDCCSGVCSQESTGTPGRCTALGGAGGGNCIQDGNPCSGDSNCCTRTCVDLGFGATVCQPVNGCRPTGNYCTTDGVCCGGEKLQNAVDCRNNRCDNPSGCNPVGNICGDGLLPDGGVIDVNARQACCDGQKAVCKVDSSGVPRCFGGCPGGQCPQNCPTGYTGEAGCCIAGGAQCQFSDQCCSGQLCLPSDGGFTCQAPPQCDPVGTECQPDASTCCSGTTCQRVSELTYACRPVATRPDGGTGGTDGGTGGGTDAGTGLPDGGSVCTANGRACTSGAACCSGICNNGTCQAPQACQPQGSACTSASDCCVGLGCRIPGGSTAGTCEPGATCSAAGQACSSSSPCCFGMRCETEAGSTCDGTQACTCAVIIN